MVVDISLSDAEVERIAARVAELLCSSAEPRRRTLMYANVSEAAEYLRCSKQRIYDLVSSGKLRVHKDGNRSLFTFDDLDALLIPIASALPAPR